MQNEVVTLVHLIQFEINLLNDYKIHFFVPMVEQKFFLFCFSFITVFLLKGNPSRKEKEKKLIFHPGNGNNNVPFYHPTPTTSSATEGRKWNF